MSRRLIAGLLVATALVVGGRAVGTESPKPEYLPYVEFAADDTVPRIALKQAYNDAVLRYNQGLYDYHVTLQKHDQFVEIFNGSTDSVERQKAREQAEPLRARLAALRREVTSRAAAVDQAARRAADAGLTITR